MPEIYFDRLVERKAGIPLKYISSYKLYGYTNNLRFPYIQENAQLAHFYPKIFISALCREVLLYLLLIVKVEKLAICMLKSRTIRLL